MTENIPEHEKTLRKGWRTPASDASCRSAVRSAARGFSGEKAGNYDDSNVFRWLCQSLDPECVPLLEERAFFRALSQDARKAFITRVLFLASYIEEQPARNIGRDYMNDILFEPLSL